MKPAYLIILAVVIVLGFVIYFYAGKNINTLPGSNKSSSATPLPVSTPVTTIIAEGLDTPWAIVFLPDKSMLVTERAGKVRLVDQSGKLQQKPVADIKSVREYGEGGLLGMDLHPDFSNNKYVYLYYTYNGLGNNTLNRVVRMTYSENQLTNETVVVDAIPGAIYHNGGRIKFGPDKFLYVTTGDSGNPSLAQDRNSLAGKILRVTDDGKPAPGNPFGNHVYSYGHRNPQGLAWDSAGNLWENEHGPSGAETGNDEINKISISKNYGWPDIRGSQTRNGMETPVKESGPSLTWAPAGLAILGKSLYISGLRGQALYQATTDGSKVVDFKEHFQNEFGRVREIILGPDKMLYITTSNKDGRGSPKEGDDKIIKIDPSKL